MYKSLLEIKQVLKLVDKRYKRFRVDDKDVLSEISKSLISKKELTTKELRLYSRGINKCIRRLNKNLKNAITHFENVLKVIKKEKYPIEYKIITRNLYD